MTLEERLSTHLHAQAESSASLDVSPATIASTAQRRVVRQRLGAVTAAAAVLALIGLIGTRLGAEEPSALVVADVAQSPSPPASEQALLQGQKQDEAAQRDERAPAPSPTPVPTTTIVRTPATYPLQPGIVSDGRGGFVRAAGAGTVSFEQSDDGLQWRTTGEWRPESSEQAPFRRLTRVGEYYAILLTPFDHSTSSGVQAIELSKDLETWQSIQIDLGYSPVYGVRITSAIGGLVAVNDTIMVAVRSAVEADYQALGIIESDVCHHEALGGTHALHLCKGDRIEIASRQRLSAAGYEPGVRYFVGDSSGAFTEVTDMATAAGQPPLDAQPLFVVDGQFARFDTAGSILVSPDGLTWDVLDSAPVGPATLVRWVADRGTVFVGSTLGPDEPGSRYQEFEATLLRADGPLRSVLPESVHRSQIWFAPQLEAGPAGWALYVTTSSPASVGDERAWAVDVDGWNVRYVALADTYVVRSNTTEDLITYRAEDVDQAGNGDLSFFYPGTSQLAATVTTAAIRSAQAPPTQEETHQAWVFHSPDGITWTTVWESTDDLGWATVAVGDDEIILSRFGGHRRIELGP